MGRGCGSTPGGGKGSSSAGPPPSSSCCSTSTEDDQPSSSKCSPSLHLMLLGISSSHGNIIRIDKVKWDTNHEDPANAIEINSPPVATFIVLTKGKDYFLEKWRDEGARKMMRSRALASFDGARKAIPLHKCDRLLFPSVHESHWFLFVVDFITSKFIFLDSLHGASSVYHTEIKDKMIQNFINTWEESKLRRMGFKNFGIAYPILPKQVRSDACGIFVMKRMQTWDSGNPTHSYFKMKDVQDARVRFAVDILFSLHNTIQEVKKLIKHF